jgi:hypothetical protein
MSVLDCSSQSKTSVWHQKALPPIPNTEDSYPNLETIGAQCKPLVDFAKRHVSHPRPLFDARKYCGSPTQPTVRRKIIRLITCAGPYRRRMPIMYLVHSHIVPARCQKIPYIPNKEIYSQPEVFIPLYMIFFWAKIHFLPHKECRLCPLQRQTVNLVGLYANNLSLFWVKANKTHKHTVSSIWDKLTSSGLSHSWEIS